MSVTAKVAKGKGQAEPIEMDRIFVGVFSAVAVWLLNYPEHVRSDMADLLKVMGQSDEEMSEGVITLRELMKGRSGSLVEMPPSPKSGRDQIVARWSTYAGGKVREFRKAAKWTQQELAEKASLPQSHISRIESGEISPTGHTIQKIAKALDRKVSDFDPSAD